MDFKIEILDTKDLPDAQWILCKGNLMEYLKALKPTYYEFIIQRKIVKNRYLNSLTNTVVNGEPLPMITLTSTKKLKNPEIGAVVSLDMGSVEILDGLQRTFRLWAYAKIIDEYFKPKQPVNDPLSFAKMIKADYPGFFDAGIITLTTIKDYYNKNYFPTLQAAFKDFEVYFFIWNGLTPSKVIHKMLVLNAGQRPVSLTHQYELLFLFVWEEIKATAGIQLFRERDDEAAKIRKGDRGIGDYMFSSVIAGLRSYVENKPMRLSIDDLDIDDLRTSETSSQNINEDIFSKKFLELFLQDIKRLDQTIYDTENENGKKWFGRDTTISGMLAGLGKYAEVNENIDIDSLINITKQAFDSLIQKIKVTGYALNSFENEYYTFQSRTVNVGTFVRRIIMDYTVDLLNGKSPDWKTLFEKSKSKTDANRK